MKLQALLADKVAQQEKLLGFKFEAADIKETEEILRNKYCGKAGLFSSMDGGGCEENVIEAAFCGDGTRASNSAGCYVAKPRPVDNGPPKAPTLPSLSIPSGLPSLPF